MAANSGAARTGTITVGDQRATVDQAAAPHVIFSLTNVAQICKTKINKNKGTTNTTCRLNFNLVAHNTGTTRSSKSKALLWLEQDSVFNPTTGRTPFRKTVIVLKAGKSITIKIRKKKCMGYQTGTFIYATDDQTNILAFVEVPSPK